MRRLDYMDFSHVERERERPRRTLGEVVKRHLMVISGDLIFKETEWHHVIHVADFPQWDISDLISKSFCLYKLVLEQKAL